MVVIVTTSGRLVCQTCYSCSSFSILHGPTIHWDQEHTCLTCSGTLIWEPCTIIGFDRHRTDPDQFFYGSDAIARP